MTELEKHLLKRIDKLEKTIGAILLHHGPLEAVDEWMYSVGRRDMELLAMDEQIPREMFD